MSSGAGGGSALSRINADGPKGIPIILANLARETGTNRGGFGLGIGVAQQTLRPSAVELTRRRAHSIKEG